MRFPDRVRRVINGKLYREMLSGELHWIMQQYHTLPPADRECALGHSIRQMGGRKEGASWWMPDR